MQFTLTLTLSSLLTCFIFSLSFSPIHHLLLTFICNRLQIHLLSLCSLLFFFFSFPSSFRLYWPIYFVTLSLITPIQPVREQTEGTCFCAISSQKINSPFIDVFTSRSSASHFISLTSCYTFTLFLSFNCFLTHLTFHREATLDTRWQLLTGTHHVT